MCDESHHVVAYISCPGFADTKVEFDLIPSDHIPHKDPNDPDSDDFTPAVVPEPMPTHGGH